MVPRDFVPFELTHAAQHSFHILVPLTCPKNQKNPGVSAITRVLVFESLYKLESMAKISLKPNRNVF